MKYWRGYLTAAIIAFFTWALMEFAETHTVLVDMIYPYVTRMAQTTLAQWSSGTPLLLWQLGAVILGLCLLASIVWMVILRWNPIQWLGWVLAAASLLAFLHTGLYGLNAHAGPIADDIRLETSEYTLSELEAATVYYRDKANALATQIRRDSNDRPLYPTFQELAEQAGEGFETLTYQHSYSIFAGSTLPVKELGWADMYTSMGITGFTMSLTGEAAVNPQAPEISLPFTMCHEMAHRMCIANERDANMAAYLACKVNSSVEFQYSAYFMAYRYCYNALVSINSVASREAAQRVSAGVDTLLRRDLTDYQAFFEINRDDQATDFANTVNDTYIKVSGDDQGIASYGDVCDLLVNWHIQQIVLPQLEVEEDKFDPFDESQVDLSGIVNAPVQNDENADGSQ